MEKLLQRIEALIFSADQPISFKDIKVCLAENVIEAIHKKDIQAAIEALIAKYKVEEYSFEIVEIAGGYQFLTKGAYHDIIGTFLKLKSKKKLSKAALEALSIIAYKQPITKTEIELIRGVNSDYSVQKLLEKELVTIVGRSEKPGRPLLYATSPKFMDYFGIGSLKDLPKIKDFKTTDNEIGAPVAIEENRNTETVTEQGESKSDSTTQED